MGNKKNCQQFLPVVNDGVSLLSQMKKSIILLFIFFFLYLLFSLDFVTFS